MRRARINRFGKPSEVVELVELESPAPAPGEVRIKVEASPINPADILKCYGRYGYRDSVPKPPFWGGVEGVGRVIEAGEAVRDVKAGDLVSLARLDGVWGDEIIARADRLTVLPAGTDPLQAAMLVVNPPTAELMLADFVDLAPGDWVIQNAANSAVGHHVIRLAAKRGCKTVNVVRRDEAVAPLEAFGGDVVVVVDGEDLSARVEAAVGGAPIGLALDAVGGEATARLGTCLAPGATVINYGLLSGESCRMPGTLTVFNDIRLRGFWLPRSLRARPLEQVRDLYGRLLGLLLDGTLGVRIEASYPLDRIAAALDHAERGGRDGKILITP